MISYEGMGRARGRGLRVGGQRDALDESGGEPRPPRPREHDLQGVAARVVPHHGEVRGVTFARPLDQLFHVAGRFGVCLKMPRELRTPTRESMMVETTPWSLARSIPLASGMPRAAATSTVWSMTARTRAFLAAPLSPPATMSSA